ncbi:MAG TPA: hypothetical protein VMV03_14725 [Spirochaetia bacterium]|nr:hypothetical protein [Spirochaetia bacterium]
MKRITILLSCLAIGGCLPAFLVELNSSAGLTAKMSSVGTLGPVSLGGSNVTNVRFLPLRPTASTITSVSLQSGFMITESGSDYLQFGYVDSNGQSQVLGGQPLNLTAGDPHYPNNQFEVSTSAGTIVAFNLLPQATSTGYVFAVTLPSGPFTGPTNWTMSAVLSASSVLGVSADISTANSFDFLFWNATGFAEGSTTASGTVATATRSGLSMPGVSTVRSLYSTVNGVSCASSFSGSQWVCYRWTSATSPALLPGVTHRIDAVLTSGDLLSTEDGILRLYDQNGSQVVSVSLGGLQFCYEAYVGTTAYVFFSLPINLHGNGWSFRVYAIPTSSMRSLGD